MANELTWHDVLAEEKQQPYFLNTLQTVASERQSGVTIYPPQKDVFNAFRFTELGDVKVVILGQDPYHGPGQAHGLAFSVRPGIATPPSLLNMYKELENTIPGFTRPNHGYLESWARQGVAQVLPRQLNMQKEPVGIFRRSPALAPWLSGRSATAESGRIRRQLGPFTGDQLRLTASRSGACRGYRCERAIIG